MLAVFQFSESGHTLVFILNLLGSATGTLRFRSARDGT